MNLEVLNIIPIMLFSIAFHEAAHGWMANRLGDPTAKQLGRITLNPVPHIDPVGSIIVPLISLLVSGRVFIAWAKPVPVNPMNFSNYRRDDMLVSIAGPVSNIIMAFACTVIFILLSQFAPDSYSPFEKDSLASSAWDYLLMMFGGGILLNVGLAVFNMIPVPPLDGSHVLASYLPESVAEQYENIGFFGIFLVVMLMNWQPFASVVYNVVAALALPFFVMIRMFT
ncbi:MAG: site-2 protease family protein [Ignavibacteriae bacterium]|nr:site-2 protease family protein [Ignavibacteriota bacterium]